MRKNPSMITAALSIAALAGLTAMAALTGCSATPKPPQATASLYQRLGGHDAIVAVVDDAIANAATDSRINRRFDPAALPHLKKTLVELVCIRTGGPCTYTGRDMAAAHEGMFIRDEEFDALVEDMTRSLDKFKVPARERAEALAILAQMRNSITDH